jgi:hypothetical protein
MSTTVRLGIGGAVLALAGLMGGPVAVSVAVSAHANGPSESISADAHWCC